MAYSSVERIEVPVTRKAHVDLVGVLNCGIWVIVTRMWKDSIDDWTGVTLQPGDQVAVMSPGGAWRSGIGHVRSEGCIDLGSVSSACAGDGIYRVEPA